jgi:hypothetical protein
MAVIVAAAPVKCRVIDRPFFEEIGLRHQMDGTSSSHVAGISRNHGWPDHSGLLINSGTLTPCPVMSFPVDIDLLPYTDCS